ncbi:MAG: type II secretion system F family protein [Candidatus Omnitrophota bacterium]
MPAYTYTAKNKNGNSVDGILDAKSDMEVSEILHKQDLTVISIKLSKNKFIKTKAVQVKLDDLVIFSRQLATMIEAGISLVQCLGILSEQIENKGLKSVVTIIRQDIEGGMSFCDALAKHPGVFSELFVSMTKAGETSGMLDEVLDRLAGYLEKSAALNRKIRSSLVYPAVVVTIAVAITFFLLIKVVPTFKNIFETLGGKLPTPTLILIGISNLVKKWFLVFIIVLIVFAVILKKYINTKKGRYRFDKFKLNVIILGELFRKVALAKFARTFSTLIKSGVSVLSSLEIVATTSGNKVIEETIMKCRESVREGETMYQPLSRGKVFPPMVTRMISVGEQTGQLEKMLSKIADFYDEQVDSAVAGLTSLIEPMVIVFLGFVVGGIVVALFLPIFKITELIAK